MRSFTASGRKEQYVVTQFFLSASQHFTTSLAASISSRLVISKMIPTWAQTGCERLGIELDWGKPRMEIPDMEFFGLISHWTREHLKI